MTDKHRVPIEAITRLVEYLHADEQKDFARRAAEHNAQENRDGLMLLRNNHIFTSVKTVAEWLQTTTPHPDF